VRTTEQLSDLNDDELMIRLQGGENAAFEQLVRRYQGPLFGFFLKNIRDAQLAEDLSQETLLRVYNQFWDYLPTGRFRGWMYRIARNLMIDNIRRQSHDALVRAVKGRADDENDTLARIAGELESPDEIASHSELASMVDEVLDEIPEEQRLTFTLHHYGGLTLPEVANVMQTALPTTKSRLRLAREKLQEKLAIRGVRDPKRTDDLE
jgi:RNA polymerase sigma-70 factor (ECF subfamily)